MIGKIKFFNEQEGYGFIVDNDNKEYFFHINQVSKQKEDINIGVKVGFEVGSNEKGLVAHNILFQDIRKNVSKNLHNVKCHVCSTLNNINSNNCKKCNFTLRYAKGYGLETISSNEQKKYNKSLEIAKKNYKKINKNKANDGGMLPVDLVLSQQEKISISKAKEFIQQGIVYYKNSKKKVIFGETSRIVCHKNTKFIIEQKKVTKKVDSKKNKSANKQEKIYMLTANEILSSQEAISSTEAKKLIESGNIYYLNSKKKEVLVSDDMNKYPSNALFKSYKHGTITEYQKAVSITKKNIFTSDSSSVSSFKSQKKYTEPKIPIVTKGTLKKNEFETTEQFIKRIERMGVFEVGTLFLHKYDADLEKYNISIMFHNAITNKITPVYSKDLEKYTLRDFITEISISPKQAKAISNKKMYPLYATIKYISNGLYQLKHLAIKEHSFIHDIENLNYYKLKYHKYPGNNFTLEGELMNRWYYLKQEYKSKKGILFDNKYAKKIKQELNELENLLSYKLKKSSSSQIRHYFAMRGRVIDIF